MKNFKILCSIFCLLTVFSLFAQTTTIFVSAHPDDWQLFMNPNAYHSVKEGGKVVFIHTTSGDGGNEGSSYYTAREQASLRALRFLKNVSAPYTTGLGMDMHQEEVTITGLSAGVQHYILKYTYGNIVAYFLRLPDGGLDGSGTLVGEGKSMKKLYNGEVTSMVSVDHRNSYFNATDLRETLKSIVKNESSGYTFFHIADTDLKINPNDHSDHIYSAKFVEDVANEIKNGRFIYYQDYCTNGMKSNILNDDLWINIATWGVTGSGLADYESIAGTTWQPNHNCWVDKQYFRTVLIEK